MYETISESVEASWKILEAASLYLLMGFVVAGIIRGYVNAELVEKYLQRGRFRSVFYASILGIPIPLCSCGVVPAVAGFKRQGANRGACLSFLISTPETGIDSIALTYSLLGPILTLMRPITAFITAMCAGFIENFTGNSYDESRSPGDVKSTGGDVCCESNNCRQDIEIGKVGFISRLKIGMSFALNDLLQDIAPWLIVGILLAGIVTAIIPDSLVNSALGRGFGSYIIALVISVPMYMCATLSTPIAVALVMKGMSPGAAMVMLMAGPATNVATIIMVAGLLGKRSLAIYMGSIVVCTVAMAYVTDLIYESFGIYLSPSGSFQPGEGIIMERLELLGAIVLIVLIIRSLWKSYLIRRVQSGSGLEGSVMNGSGSRCSCSCGGCDQNEQKPTS